jgi:hypothetical protein
MPSATMILSKELLMRRLALLLALLLTVPTAYTAGLQRVVISAPGPRNISYLPVELKTMLAASRCAAVSDSLFRLPTTMSYGPI